MDASSNHKWINRTKAWAATHYTRARELVGMLTFFQKLVIALLLINLIVTQAALEAAQESADQADDATSAALNAVSEAQDAASEARNAASSCRTAMILR